MNKENPIIKVSSDTCIRFLLGSPGLEDIPKSFINAVLGALSLPKAVWVKIMNPFNLAGTKDGKETILDILVSDEESRIYNIEVQSHRESAFNERSLYYWSKLYTPQLKKGDSFTKLRPVTSINILDFNAFRGITDYFNSFSIRNDKHNDLVLTNHLKMVFIELPKLSDTIPTDLTALDRWAYFIHYGHREDINIMNLVAGDENLSLAYEQYKEFKEDTGLVGLCLTQEEQDMLKEYEIEKRTEEMRKTVESNNKKMEEMEKMMENNNKKMENNNKKMENNNKNVAKNILKLDKNADIDYIMKITELGRKTVEKIKEELYNTNK